MQQGRKIVEPAYLKAGDKVAIVSPAYWIPQDAIQMAANVIRSWGLVPVIGPHTKDLNVNAYAGTADQRAADLLWALEDDSIKAIMCGRGGYGTIHLVERIPTTTFIQHPKWIIGHGDITTLLCAQAALGIMSIHGPMVLQMATEQTICINMVRELLFGSVPQYVVPSHKNNIQGHAEGVLVGGNLSSFAALVGTKYDITDTDIIIFIEESEEALHNIDRLFCMLRLQKNFHHVKGVIFGEFTAIRYDLEFDSPEQMLIEHLKRLNIPVCCGFPVGSNSFLPLIEGAFVHLDVNAEEMVLTFDMEGNTKPIHTKEITTPLFR